MQARLKHRGHAARHCRVVHGEAYAQPTPAYPLLLAPLVGVLPMPAVFYAAHALNCVLMASAAGADLPPRACHRRCCRAGRSWRLHSAIVDALDHLLVLPDDRVARLSGHRCGRCWRCMARWWGKASRGDASAQLPQSAWPSSPAHSSSRSRRCIPGGRACCTPSSRQRSGSVWADAPGHRASAPAAVRHGGRRGPRTSRSSAPGCWLAGRRQLSLAPRGRPHGS